MKEYVLRELMLILHQKHLTEELMSLKENNQNLIQRNRTKEKRGRDPEIRERCHTLGSGVRRN